MGVRERINILTAVGNKLRERKEKKDQLKKLHRLNQAV